MTPHMMPEPWSGERSSMLRGRLAWILAAAYTFIAALIMWFAPRVPYADGWRFLGHFAKTHFPKDVLLADNGHYEVLPNAVRVLDMRVFDATQTLQIVVGMALLAASLLAIWRILRRLPDPDERAVTMLVAVLGLCWLGNVRTLAHANESVHAYAVTFALLLGIGALIRRPSAPSKGDAVLAVLCGILATLSFGSGIAVFVSFMAIAVIRRASWGVLATLVSGAVVAFVLVRMGGAGAAPQLAPLAQLDLGLRWLAAPWMYAALPAVDSSVAARVPVDGVRDVLLALAQGWEQVFGPASKSRWPHLAVGTAGVVLLVILSMRTWWRRHDSRGTLAGLGLAWFALAVGGLVALVRMPYFDTFPDQLMAPRYVVWSSLFWAGLGVAWSADAVRKRRALAVALVVGIALLPSQVWMAQLARTIHHVAMQTAAAAVVGVLDPALETGETVPAELASAVPDLRRAGVASFAWPEAKVLGARVHNLVSIDTGASRVEVVENRLGPPGRRMRFQTGWAGSKRLLLVDGDDIARGLAIPEPGGTGMWSGWMKGTSRAPVRVMALPAHHFDRLAAGNGDPGPDAPPD